MNYQTKWKYKGPHPQLIVFWLVVFGLTAGILIILGWVV